MMKFYDQSVNRKGTISSVAEGVSPTRDTSGSRKAELDFLHHLELGRQFEALELYGQATAEFRQAEKAIPDRHRPLVKVSSIKQAESAYQEKDFATAAKASVEAFSQVVAKTQ